MKLPICSHKHVEPRAAGTRRLMMLTPTYLTTDQSQSIGRMPTSWSLWTISIKLLSAPSRLEHTIRRALAHRGPLCLDKAIKIFFLLRTAAPQNMTLRELARQKNLCERLKPFERYLLLLFSSQHVFLKQQFYATSHISTLNSIPHSATH